MKYKGDWQRSVQPIIDIFERRVKRLSLKEVSFEIHDPCPCSDQELEYFIEKNSGVGRRITNQETKQRVGKKKTEVLQQLPRFFESPLPRRPYAFQIRRCGEPDCCQSQNQVEWLPYSAPDSENPGHYKPFKDIYGPNPTEEFRHLMYET